MVYMSLHSGIYLFPPYSVTLSVLNILSLLLYHHFIPRKGNENPNVS